MFETAAETAELHDLLGASLERAGEHTRSINVPGERQPSVQEMLARLQGLKHFVVGTTTEAGLPRVSVVDGHFLHGRLWFSSDAAAYKIRHLGLRPGISAAHVAGDEFAVTIHGLAMFVEPGDVDFGMLEAYWRSVYDGHAPSDWAAHPVYVKIEPTWMLAYLH